MSSKEADLFGDGIDIEKEELKKLRIEKMIENDRWQSCNFRDFQGGEWAGMYCAVASDFSYILFAMCYQVCMKCTTSGKVP
jgi:hypothetical protein